MVFACCESSYHNDFIAARKQRGKKQHRGFFPTGSMVHFLGAQERGVAAGRAGPGRLSVIISLKSLDALFVCVVIGFLCDKGAWFVWCAWS